MWGDSAGYILKTSEGRQARSESQQGAAEVARERYSSVQIAAGEGCARDMEEGRRGKRIRTQERGASGTETLKKGRGRRPRRQRRPRVSSAASRAGHTCGGGE